MKSYKVILILFLILISTLSWAVTRDVSPLVLSEWTTSDPWNQQCPTNDVDITADAGSGALSIAKIMKYWNFPQNGLGSIDYTDDNFGQVTVDLTGNFNWDDMSNWQERDSTFDLIHRAGAAIYTNWEETNSTSELAAIYTALVTNFYYSSEMQLMNRADYNSFSWKNYIRQELDALRPVIYSAYITELSQEVIFIIDGYDSSNNFHYTLSDGTIEGYEATFTNLVINGYSVSNSNQKMIRNIRPAGGPVTVDESFENGFNEFNWYFEGFTNWDVTTNTAYYGTHSARAGNINHNQNSSLLLQLNVAEEDTISFWAKTSCEYENNNQFDFLAFFIDDVEIERWSGISDWFFKEYIIQPGLHEFRWTYQKDGATSNGDDTAYLDGLQLPEGTTLLSPARFLEAELVNTNDIELNWMPPSEVSPDLIGYKVVRNNIEIAHLNSATQTTFVDYNMANGFYQYTVRAVYNQGLSPHSNSSSVAIEVPYAPQNLTFQMLSINSVELSWIEPPALRNRALLGYKVYADNILIEDIENSTTLSTTISDLEEGIYYYTVTAVYDAEESAHSNTVIVAIGVPEPPQNFNVQLVDNNRAHITWTSPVNTLSLEGYRIYRDSEILADNIDIATFEYFDEDLSNGSYSYYMIALFETENSGATQSVTIDIEVAYPPTNLVANVVNDIDIQLSWSNPESTTRSLTNYMIYRDGSIIAAIYNPSITTYIDQNLANGIYEYQVSAIYSGTESELSAVTEITMEYLYPPTSFEAGIDGSTANLTWVTPATSGGPTRSFNGFNIYANNELSTFIPNAQATEYSLENLVNGIYSFQIAAVYSSGNSEMISVENLLVEVLYPPTNLSHTIDYNDISLTWNAASTSRAMLGYSIYKNGSLLTTTNATTYVDEELSNGNYSYYITTNYDSGESVASNTLDIELEVTYPITTFTAIAENNSAQLSWSAPFGSRSTRALLSYNIYKDSELFTNTTAVSYSDDNLNNGIYNYSISAVYDAGESALTPAIPVTIEVLYPISNLNYSVYEKNNISLDWTIPTASGGLDVVQSFNILRNSVQIANVTELAFSDTDLADGAYSYQIEVVYNSGVSTSSSAVNTSIEYPFPISNLTTEVDGSNVSLAWELENIGTSNFDIYRDDNLIGNSSELFYSDNGLSNGTYSYYIITNNDSESGSSEPSTIETAIVHVNYPASNLTYQVIGNSVTLNWNAPVNGPRSLLSYNVYMNGSDLITNSTTTSTVVENLANGSYYFEVAALYDDGEAVLSNRVDCDIEVLYPVTNLEAQTSETAINLTWAVPVTNSRALLNYSVYRDGQEITTVATTNYLDDNLTNAHYTYYVTANYTSGESAASNSVSGDIEVLYSALNLTYQVNEDVVSLEWEIPANAGLSVLTYKVVRDNVEIAQTSNLSYSDEFLANGTYSYSITASYNSGDALTSNIVNAEVEVTYPINNLTFSVAGDDVSLNWDIPVTSARELLSYNIYRDNTLLDTTTEFTYADENLANGSYDYYVTATYSSGESEPSAVVTATVEVLYPTGNLTYEVSENNISLNWEAAPTSAREFITYNIYKDSELLTSTTNLTYNDENLVNNSYEYYVTANYTTGESVASNSVNPLVEVLYPTLELTLEVTGDDVSLNWNISELAGNSVSYFSLLRDGEEIAQVNELTYTDNNLANGTYNYSVVTIYNSGSAEETLQVEAFIEVLYPASNLSFLVEENSILLSWDSAPTSATRAFLGYKLYRDGELVYFDYTTNYNDQDLVNNSYEYYVEAIYTTGVSATSNTVNPTVEVLYSALNLTYQVNEDVVSLEWEIPANAGLSVLTYKVVRDNVEIAQTSNLSYSDEFLANGTYSYSITASYNSGDALTSNIVNAEVEVTYPINNLTFSVAGDDVSLNWDIPVTSARELLSYNIYRDNTLLDTTTEFTYADENLANGSYDYYVTATYSSGESEPSAVVTATVEVLYPTGNLTYEVSENNISLNWEAAPTSAREFITYNIYKDSELLTSTTNLTYNDENLVNNSYEYYVTANYTTGESVASNSVNPLVEVLYPTLELTLEVTGDDVSLNWNISELAGNSVSYFSLLRDGEEIAQVNELTYTDNNLANGTYNYSVVTIYNSGSAEETLQVEAFIEVLYPASNLTYTLNGSSTTLYWNAAPITQRELLNYNIYRDGDIVATTSSLEFTDETLTNGIYDYYVAAQYSTGESAPTNTISVTIEVFYAPSNLVGEVDADFVNLSWDYVPTTRDLIGYNLYRDNEIITMTTSLAYSDVNLTNNNYEYYVTALYDSGESEGSNTLNIVIEVTYPVTELSANVIENSVELSWTIPAISATTRAFTGYFVYRDNELLTILENPSLTSWLDSNLANGDYDYYMRAVYDSGISVVSNTVSVNIEVLPDLFPPTNLTFTLDNVRDVTLNWNAPAADVVSYKIFKDNLEIADIEAITYADYDLVNGSYTYFVKAIYAEGISSPSNSVTANIQVTNAPDNVTASVYNGNNVLITWNAPYQNETAFIIYKDGEEYALITDASQTEYHDENLTNASYSYTLRAVYDNLVSVETAPVYALVENAVTPEIITGSVENRTVTFSWNDLTSWGELVNYTIYRNGVEVNDTSDTFFSQTELPNGQYSYGVIANFTFGSSEISELFEATVVIANPVTSLETEVDYDDVTLTWLAPVDTGLFQHYSVERDNSVIGTTVNNTFTDENLSNGSYEYKVTAVFDGASATSDPVSASVLIAHPLENIVLTPTENSMLLTWNNPADMAGFVNNLIYRDEVLIATLDETHLSYLDENLNNGMYDYMIRTVYTGDNHLDSAIFSSEVLVPASPSNISVTINIDDITVAWNEPTDNYGITGYNLYDGEEIFATVETNEYSAIIPNGVYAFTVKTIYPSVLSEASELYNAEIVKAYPVTNLDYSVLNSAVELSWDLPQDLTYLTNIRINKIVDGNNEYIILPATSTSYSDANNPNGIYSYGVAANYESADIPEVWINLLDIIVMNAYPVTDLTVQEDGENIALTWNAPSSIEGLVNYQVYINDSLVDSTTDTSYSTPQTGNGIYEVYVKSIFLYDNQATSTVETLTIINAYPVQNLACISTDSELEITWDAPTDIFGFFNYIVYLNGEVVAQTTNNIWASNTVDNGLHNYAVESVYTNSESSTVNSTTPHELLFPYPVGSISVNIVSIPEANTPEINWTAPEQLYALTGYRVFSMLNEQQYQEDQWVVVEALCTELIQIDEITEIEDNSYRWAIKAVYEDNEGNTLLSEATISGIITDLEIETHPFITQFNGNYPNPFNPETEISFDIAKSGNVRLEVYNIKGQLVKSLINEEMKSGSHRVSWFGKNSNNRNVSSGVYFFRLTNNSSTKVHKAILMK